MNKKVVIYLFLLILAVVAYIAIKPHTAVTTTVLLPATTGQSSKEILPLSHCGLTVNNIEQHVVNTNYTIKITGVIDNSHQSTIGCNWIKFEGQAGTVRLYSQMSKGENTPAIWNQVGKTSPITLSTDWMSDPAVFMSEINFDNTTLGFHNGTDMKIVLTEENPSDGPTDSLEFQFKLEK